MKRKELNFIRSEKKNTIRLSLDMSKELNQRLEELANKTHSTKSEVLRRAIILFDVVTSAESQGKKFGIPKDNDDSKLEQRIVVL